MDNLNDFIIANADAPVSSLRLRYSDKKYSAEQRAQYMFAILQIEARQKYKAKFRDLLGKYPDFLFPDLLACEQASHEAVANYHASLSGNCDSLIDMTAGLGIDFITIANAISSRKSNPHSSFVALELNPEKASVLNLNIARCGLPNAVALNSESISYISEMAKSGKANLNQHPPTAPNCLIFADPARRGEGNKRIYDPADCSPDIVSNWDLLKRIAARIIVKNSPMLDISRALQLFPDASEFHIVSLKNECKEVLIVYDKETTHKELESKQELSKQDESKGNHDCKKIICVNIEGDSAIERYEISVDQFLNPAISPVADNSDICGKYLYVPNSSVMKIASRGSLTENFPSLKKLSPNCHLYLSDELCMDFPGRILRIEKILENSEKKQLAGMHLNVAVRNYPLSADKLKKSLKISSATSNKNFLYGATISPKEKPLLIIASTV